MFKNTTDKTYYSNEYTSVPANDYSISTVRAYLNGKTINTTTYKSTVNKWVPSITTKTDSNFFSQNKLKEENEIYTLIQPRSLKSMYSKMSASSTDLALPTTVEGLSETDSDAFWLLSYNEKNNLWNSADDIKGNLINKSIGSWWLRSPGNLSNPEQMNYDAGFIYNGGYFGCDVYYAWYAIRAAFLI